MNGEKKKTAMQNDKLYTRFDNIFFEKTRLSMMTILYREKKVSFNRFRKLIGASDGAVYTHLQKLEDAKYIDQKKEIVGNKMQTVYFLTKTGMYVFKEYLVFLESVIRDKK